jgi:hypothetical protein
MAKTSLYLHARKRCSRCKETYPATTDYFFLRYINKDQQDVFSSWCKACCRTQKRESWQSMSPDDKITKSQRRKARYTINAVAICKERRLFRQNHPEYEKNYRKPYRKRSPHVPQGCRARRAARKRGLPAQWTKQDWMRALAHWQNACAVCGNQEGLFWTLVPDHWIPLSHPSCPGTIPTNIIPLCHNRRGNYQSCNNTKTNRDPVTWLEDKLGIRKATQKLRAIHDYFESVRQEPC